MRRRVLAIAAAVALGTAGCIAFGIAANVIGDAVGTVGEVAGAIAEARRQMTTTPEENHELQKSTAITFRERFPATEAIRYTSEGTISGAGSWAANGVVTIAGEDYRMIMGPSELGGDPLPAPDSLPPTRSTNVHYSDGSSEVLP